MFHTMIASLPTHDELVAEIYCDGLFVAMVSQERGKGLFDMETPAPNLVESEIMRRVDANGFIKAVEEACLRLQAGKTD